MTAQLAERLIYEGREVPLCTEPLESYFALVREHPRFAFNCTALWRGYVGTWEIIDNKLYLVGLDGMLEDGSRVTLETFFPDGDGRVFASWYSGTLRIPEGRLLEYVHMGYASTYERDRLLTVRHGVIVATELRENGVPAGEDAPEGYSVSAMLVFGPRRRDEGEGQG